MPQKPLRISERSLYENETLMNGTQVVSRRKRLARYFQRFSMSKRILISILALSMLLILMCFFQFNEEKPRISSNKNPTNMSQKVEPMHIFFSVIGENNVPRLLNTLKSLLYYQNRVRHDRERCLISMRNATVLPCSRNRKTVSRRAIHLHLLSDERTREILRSNISQWTLQNVTWTIYPMEKHLIKVKWIKNVHSAGPPALMKLTLATILPGFVHKVNRISRLSVN
ncbi:hypothetical protein D915_008039 [Fasciola hepatica]|uniref:Uncharacterized protein n=1 Tax=Fasciola hepatica TaxID=6192 RepID=A0A4E0R660_FASHE|nr:hypothetical protein D915_008039 [Fasciola hepatica]